MFSLLPIVINLVSAVIIFTLSKIKMNIGRVWLIAAILSILNWGFIFGVRWLIPLRFEIVEWFPIGEIFQRAIVFQVDSISWPLLFALCAVQTTVIITDSSRLNEIPSPNIWTGVFLVYSVGFLAVLSNSIITFFLLWALVDLIELIVLIRTVSTTEQTKEVAISFAVKILGIFLLILGFLVSFNKGLPLGINQITNEVGIYILLAVGLRLGVIPFNLPFVSGSPVRRWMGNGIRMISVSTSIIVLLRLPIASFEESTLNLLLTLTSLGILFGAIMWYSSKDELEGRPYWIITLAGLSIFSSVQGVQFAALSWSLVLILCGSVLFLYSARGRIFTIIPLIAVIGISGLPFTPAAAGWQGIVVEGNIIHNLIKILSVSFIILGFMKHLNYTTTLLSEKEKWIWITYPIGLILLIITHWLIVLFSDLKFFVPGDILVSTIAFLIPIVIYFLITKFIKATEYVQYFQNILTPFGKIFTNFLSLRWLYKILWTILGFIQRIVNIFANLLEGQGGIVWVIVFLIMIITLISSGDLS